MSSKFNSETDFARWNEEMAHKYDPEAYHLRSNFLIRWIERRRVKMILRYLNVEPQDSVLEIGCGAGNVLEQIKSDQLHGVDLSTFLLKKSQQRLAFCQTKFARANAERLPFVDRQFSKLICSEVLEHVAHPRCVISEIARVATDKSIIVISVPNEAWIDWIKGIIRSLGLERWLLQGSNGSYHSPNQMTDEWHLHSFGLTLLEEVSKNILVIQHTKAVPFSFIPLRYVASCQVIEREQ